MERSFKAVAQDMSSQRQTSSHPEFHFNTIDLTKESACSSPVLKAAAGDPAWQGSPIDSAAEKLRQAAADRDLNAPWRNGTLEREVEAATLGKSLLRPADYTYMDARAAHKVQAEQSEAPTVFEALFDTHVMQLGFRVAWPQNTYAEVADIQAHSDAHRLGILEHDVIQACNGVDVLSRDREDIFQMLKQVRPLRLTLARKHHFHVDDHSSMSQMNRENPFGSLSQGEMREPRGQRSQFINAPVGKSPRRDLDC